MNVKTITLPRNEAAEKFREYRDAVRQSHQKEDAELMRGFRALKEGRALIDVHDAMKFAGLNDKNQPKLAICRADATHCWFRGGEDGSGRFRMEENRNWKETRRSVWLPKETFPAAVLNEYKTLKAVVPSIPPRLRPNIAYSNLHILWEAEWESVPTDPMLLRHLGGALYVVLAVWDLTDLEKAVLKRHL